MRAPIGSLLSVLAIATLSGCTTQHAPVAASPCPAWAADPADLHNNEGSPYLGCTNQANLEQMLDDKRDLAHGRTLDPANGARESKAIEDYEAGKTKGPSSGAAASGTTILMPATGSSGSPQ